MQTRAPIAALFAAVLVLCAASMAMAAALGIGETATPDVTLTGEVATNIWFQGFVADTSTGEPVNATYDVVAKIFDSEGGGTLLWGPETHPATGIVDGWFNIELGHYIAMMYFDAPPYYLELTVNGEVLSPRLRLGSVPSAMVSQKAVEEDQDWVLDEGDVFRETGRVGIGTPSPSARLDVESGEHWASVRGECTAPEGTAYGVIGEANGIGSIYGVAGYGYGSSTAWRGSVTTQESPVTTT
jgi:hypothetical protein